MKLNIVESAEVPVMVKLPIAMFSLTIGITAVLGAGLSFLKSALPAASVGDYYHAAASVLGLIAGTQEPKALALFCVAHAGKHVELMSEGQLEGRNLDHGELTEWTDANAEEHFAAVHGEPPPSYD